MNQLKQIHAYTLRNGIDHNRFLIVELLRIPNIPYAHNLFNQISNPNVFLYNKLIQAYSSQNQPHQCLSLYTQMCSKKCSPNQHSYTFLFTVCASLNSLPHAQILHSHFLKSGFQSDVFTLTALVGMYAKLRCIELARKMFDEMLVRENIYVNNAVLEMYARCGKIDVAKKLFNEIGQRRNLCSWNSMIMGLAVHGKCNDALELYEQMLVQSFWLL
ncbi:hypothetical protein Pint_00630 [Pistacia integerrima]|uniref:Uncharacterized protein n=1 Tax=Pistacia integerrima TaxID=434235 RepID=A0ACC0ZR46_9ROSI|nr:hypothetical protein Pint_00630 [Pistacia integerrima]